MVDAPCKGERTPRMYTVRRGRYRGCGDGWCVKWLPDVAVKKCRQLRKRAPEGFFQTFDIVALLS